MYSVTISTKFKRDMKRCQKQRKNMVLFKTVVSYLTIGEPLPVKYKDHLLTGNWKGHRECHLEPDWLLIYRIDNTQKILTLIRIGSHAELFNM